VIFIVVKWNVRPERSAEFLDLVADFTNAVRAEPGAGSVHVNSGHFKTAMAWMPEVIATKPQIINVEVPGHGFGEMAELTPA
jgi:quinol monooxygenase YgiN